MQVVTDRGCWICRGSFKRLYSVKTSYETFGSGGLEEALEFDVDDEEKERR